MVGQHAMETEIKLRVGTLDGFQERLALLGFRVDVPFQPEESTLWDRNGELMANKSALRVRSHGESHTLTWKGPRVEDPVFKIRPEVELGIESAEIMGRVLEALGYQPVMRMVKKRAVMRRSDLTACLDEAPFGCFLELEGSKEAIGEVMAVLGLGNEMAETRSYPRLFRDYQRSNY